MEFLLFASTELSVSYELFHLTNSELHLKTIKMWLPVAHVTSGSL